MVARHVTAVHLDGCDEEGFWTWCANQAIEPMDRDHPLWRVTFATGLASGRVGVLVVMHHALADGIAGAALAARLLDPAPTRWPPSPSPWPRCPTPASSSSRSRSTAPSTTWRSSRPASPKGSTS
jgi:diacylglycerol O-acyltransferase / wax synthase